MRGKQFIEGELETPESHHINSLIMSKACDIAERLTELECKLAGIQCDVVEMDGGVECFRYTNEAQDIFNIHYDEITTELYDLLNEQLKNIECH